MIQGGNSSLSVLWTEHSSSHDMMEENSLVTVITRTRQVCVSVLFLLLVNMLSHGKHVDVSRFQLYKNLCATDIVVDLTSCHQCVCSL